MNTLTTNNQQPATRNPQPAAFPKFYRKDGRAIKRNTETEGVEVLVPPTAKEILPLCLTPVTYPSRDRFDEAVAGMEETDQEMFENYVKHFCGRVHIDIERPMTERSIKKIINGK